MARLPSAPCHIGGRVTQANPPCLLASVLPSKLGLGGGVLQMDVSRSQPEENVPSFSRRSASRLNNGTALSSASKYD
jgi:hypothetical protein